MKKTLPLKWEQRSLPNMKFWMVMKFALLLILFTAFKAQAQPSQITGTITGENGEPLTGASVKVKGTNAGASTDSSGFFRINADAKDVLVVSYVGYNDIE